MKRHSLHMLRCAAATAVLWTAPVHAQGDVNVDETRAQLDEHQARLMRRLTRIDIVGDAQGRYALVRDTYFYGAGGIGTLAEEWFAAATGWVNGWHRLLGVIENAPKLSAVDIQDGVRRELKVQQDAWTELKRKAAAVIARSTGGQLELGKIAPFPPDYVDNYGSQIAVLNDAVAELGQALGDGASSFRPGEHEAWDQLVVATENAVIGRLRKAMLQYPQLAEALERVAQAFRAEREVEPLAREVQVAFNSLRDHVLRKRLYHARKALADLRAKAAAADAAITASTLDAEFKEPTRATVRNTLDAGETLYTQSTRSFKPQALVGAFFASESRAMAAQCRDLQARKELNCDLLRALVAIPVTKVVAMNEAQLEYLEYQFDTVKAGPLGPVAASPTP